MLGSLVRSCNVTTDRLVYQDVHGMSATEPCPKGRIWGCTKPKDAGLLLGRACRELGLVWCQWMAGPVKCVAQTSARANGAGPGSSPGKSGFKAYRLYPVGIGLTPERLQSRPSPQL